MAAASFSGSEVISRWMVPMRICCWECCRRSSRFWKETNRAVIRWTLDQMCKEIGKPEPGSALMAQQLAAMMLVQVVRLYLTDSAVGGVGWLFALTDKRLHAAITAMHRAPAQRFTVQILAEHAGMSRTSFAVRFKATVGLSPMGYLTQWRMLLAANRLMKSGDAISVLGPSLGYDFRKRLQRGL